MCDCVRGGDNHRDYNFQKVTDVNKLNAPEYFLGLRGRVKCFYFYLFDLYMQHILFNAALPHLGLSFKCHRLQRVTWCHKLTKLGESPKKKRE